MHRRRSAASTERQTPLPADLARWQGRVRDYEERIGTCWQKYARRNRELAHLAANLLILLALLSDCQLICGENLATLRTEGRGRGVRGRWRNWRNNTTVRGELWRVLSYKCLLLGIRARQVEPRGTTHTCPHCHQPASTFASPAPADRKQALDWGPWLCCENPECLWNGARDYAASLNIARLGLALFLTARRRTPSQSSTLTALKVKPALYSRAGATLLLPSQGITPRPIEGKHVCYAGWSCSPRAPDVSTHGARRGALDSAPAQARPRAACPAGIAPCGCNGLPLIDIAHRQPIGGRGRDQVQVAHLRVVLPDGLSRSAKGSAALNPGRGDDARACWWNKDDIFCTELQQAIPVEYLQGGEVLACLLYLALLFRIQRRIDSGSDLAQILLDVEGHRQDESYFWEINGLRQRKAGHQRQWDRMNQRAEIADMLHGDESVVKEQIGHDQRKGMLIRQVSRFLQRPGKSIRIACFSQERGEQAAQPGVILDQQQ